MRNETFALSYGLVFGVMASGVVLPNWELVAAGVVMLAVTAGTDLMRGRQDADTTAFDVVEPVQIASDDAYDYVDYVLDDGETIVEDKRDAECYRAVKRGESDV